MGKQLEETLKKLQEGASENNATVMLEGERFRVRSEDGYSALYELDQNGGGFKVVERMTAQGTAEDIKAEGESSSVDAAIKDMEEGPRRRREEADKKRQEDEKRAEQERGGPLNPGLRAAAGVDDEGRTQRSGNPNAPGNPAGSPTHSNGGNPQQAPNQSGRPQAHPSQESISPKAHK